MTRLILALCCGAALASASLALPASAQVMGDIDVIENLMESYGLTLKQGKDPAGDPMLSSQIEGINFDVYFYGCKKDGPCDSIQFSSGFDMTQGMTIEQINGWNRNRRYGKAYLDDDGNPYIDFDLNLDGDGIGPKNFASALDIWRALLEDFTNYIGW